MDSPVDCKYLYGLIGYPLAHSFSRDFFNSKFLAEDIDAHYVNFEISDISQLNDVIAEYPNLCGLNVTAPYKQSVIPLLDDLDETAREVGAVNVIGFHRDAATGELHSLRGYNTDVVAFGKTIDGMRMPQQAAAMVLGTGGAAAAVRAALVKRGIDVTMVSRRKSVHTLVYEELTRAMVSAHWLIVNATPLGMYPNTGQSPDFPYRFLSNQHLCYDLIYNPEETLFLRNAAHYGAQTKNGLEMLLLQAMASYDVWTQDNL